MHTAVRDNNGLTLDAIRRAAPSVFAREAHSRVSDRYGFVPTVDIVEGLKATGLTPVYVSQTRTRNKAIESLQSALAPYGIAKQASRMRKQHLRTYHD